MDVPYNRGRTARYVELKAFPAGGGGKRVMHPAQHGGEWHMLLPHRRCRTSPHRFKNVHVRYTTRTLGLTSWRLLTQTIPR